MAPRATIAFPTRRRREYLAVALAAVAAQARAAGAEVIVVEDDPVDPETERLAAAHGARYVAHGAPRGLNAARNTAVDAAGSDLVCFLDDDTEAWPHWLESLLAAADGCPEHDVFGGPIRARLEGFDLPLCGREAVPVTALDLGDADRDADFVWGANLTVRRRALERFGRFDEALDLYGDEEDWQRRLRAAGGRVRYVAAAGADHRRTGRDATLGGLSRAAFMRGRHSRRYDMRKGTAPSLAGELRTLAGCLFHTARRRCANGIILAAMTAGRLREALAPKRPQLTDPDFLSGESGTLSRRGRLRGSLLDAAADTLAVPRRMLAARLGAPRRLLVLSVVRPELAGAAAAAGRRLERSRHEVDVRLIAPRPGAGKWQNLNEALKHNPVEGYDWLLIVDDDTVLPVGFLDAFLGVSERHDFRLAQPAHAYDSHAAWRITRRAPLALARRTRFVEIGPVTALHRSTFDVLLPFPDLRMGWGLDVHWAALAQHHGWPVGIVDVTPIRHTRPVATDYPRDEAMAEAQAFLAERPYVTREQAGEVLEVYRR
jgi:GT2 family glycosyltransferase